VTVADATASPRSTVDIPKAREKLPMNVGADWALAGRHERAWA
jgi:hypothetical protein